MSTGDIPPAASLATANNTAAKTSTEGDWVFVGRTGGAPAHTMRGQAERALARIADALGLHGLGLRQVSGVRYLIPHGVGADEFAGCRDLFAQAFGDPSPRPTYVATGIAPPGTRIEIEVRARRA